MLEKYWLMVDDDEIDYRDCELKNSLKGKAIYKGKIR